MLAELLKTPQLKKDLVPSSLLNQPEMYSINATAESDKTSEEQSLSTIDEVYAKFSNSNRLDNWHITKMRKNVCFMLLEEIPHPAIECLVFVNSNMLLSVTHHNVSLTSIDYNDIKTTFPFKIETVRVLKDTLQYISEYIRGKTDESNNTNENSFCDDSSDEDLPLDLLRRRSQADLEETTKGDSDEEIKTKVNSLILKYEALKKESNGLDLEIQNLEQINNALKFVALNTTESDHEEEYQIPYDSENDQDTA